MASRSPSELPYDGSTFAINAASRCGDGDSPDSSRAVNAWGSASELRGERNHRATRLLGSGEGGGGLHQSAAASRLSSAESAGSRLTQEAKEEASI